MKQNSNQRNNTLPLSLSLSSSLLLRFRTYLGVVSELSVSTAEFGSAGDAVTSVEKTEVDRRGTVPLGTDDLCPLPTLRPAPCVSGEGEGGSPRGLPNGAKLRPRVSSAPP